MSPPIIDLTFEDHIPVAFSPITDQESDSTDEEDEPHFETNYENNFSQSREYVEPSLPEHLLIHTNNLSSQPQEYVEPDFSESKYNNYLTSTLNGIQLSEQDDQNSNSDNSWDELRRLEATLDNISSDSKDSTLKMEEGEISPTPPRRMPKNKKKQKIPKRLKKTYPIMYS